MRIEVGQWSAKKKIYLDCKTIPGILNTNHDILALIRGVQQVYEPWQVGIISCDTEADHRDIQRIRILGSAKGYSLIPASVVEVAYMGETVNPMGELSHPRSFSVFCNRLPASMRNIAGLTQVCVHAIGHGFGLDHNPDLTSWMSPTVAPRIKHFTVTEIAWLNATANKDFPGVTSQERKSMLAGVNWGQVCECGFE